MKANIIILFIFLTLTSFGQSSFKKGYYITNEGVKNEGFIMNFNEKKFEEIVFKTTIEAIDILKIEKERLSEFSIGNTKYFKKNVNIELLENKMLAKHQNNTEIFKTEVKNLFIKLEFSSVNLALYSHTDEFENTYFFIDSNNNLELLEYKKIVKDGKQIKLNKYRNYLFKNFKLNDTSGSDDKLALGKMKYKLNDLINYFEAYSYQNNQTITVFNDNNRYFKDAINITPKLGYTSLSQKTNNEVSYYNTKFSNNTLNFGVDLELFVNSPVKSSSFILSYNKILNSKSESKFIFGEGNPENTDVIQEFSMNILEFKYRYYFQLSQNNFMYINGGFFIHNSKGQTKYVFTEANTYVANLEYDNTKNNPSLSLGGGLNFKNIYFEANYIPKIKSGYTSYTDNATLGKWTYERSLFNITIGYNIF